ncbi:hypothetical protein [Coleofasciculus sp. E2-BRE-01]|uniref:hypothetical protein n=1 Tax=Coleofasciculus sp. E2-BRE-01 TaxID=3069524 RepID=UPI0033041E01
MKIHLRPLYSQLNPGVGNCPLGCDRVCQVHVSAPNLRPPPGSTCPLSSHQVQTYSQVTQGKADIIFNKSATGDGKSLSASLPSLLNPSFRFMGLYPTIELVEDQTHQQKVFRQFSTCVKPWQRNSIFSPFGLTGKSISQRLVIWLKTRSTRRGLMPFPRIGDLRLNNVPRKLG